MASDVIYREDAKDFVRHAYHKGLNPIDYLDEVPAADVRPVVRGRGKWIKKGCYAFCSNCGERIAITWLTTVEEMVNVYRLKFCNNCGADMRPETQKKGGGEDG